MKKQKRNNKTQNSHGFTLIELLAVVIIIGIVIGSATTIYLSSIKSTKDNSKILAINNVKAAAELFAKEQNNKIKWIIKYENYQPIEKYICTTVQDLINAGYFKPDFYKNENYKNKINQNTVIEIHQSNNYSDIEVKIHSDNSIDINQCIAMAMNQNLKDIKINNLKLYTDRSHFDITDDNNSTLDYGINYIDKDNRKVTKKCENNKCSLTNLAQYSNYAFTLCPEKDSIISCKELAIQTLEIEKPTIHIDPLYIKQLDKKINIHFSNKNIYNEGYYYFKIDVNAISEKNVYECANETAVDNNSCQNNTTTKEIKAGTWYQTKVTDITMTTNPEGTVPKTPKVYARTKDESKNTAETIEIIKRLRTNTYVTIRFKPNGGTIVPKTTNPDGTINNWSIGSDGLIYLNNSLYEQKVEENTNIGTNGLTDYNDENYLNITKFGYTGASSNEWKCLEGCNQTFDQSKNYKGKDFCDLGDDDCTIVLGVNWTRDFTCAQAGGETTYMGKKWYTITNNETSCELALKDTVGNTNGNKYNDATGTGTASVYNYIKDFSNGKNKLQDEYTNNFITTIDTNVTETVNTINAVTGSYWVSDGKIYDSSNRSYSTMGSTYKYYTSAMPYCESPKTVNDNGDACSQYPKVREAIKKPTEATRLAGYYKLSSDSSSQTFITIGACTKTEYGSDSWTRGHPIAGDKDNLKFVHVNSGNTAVTNTADMSKSFRFYMCGMNNDNTDYNNKEMIIFKQHNTTQFSYTNWHMGIKNEVITFNKENYVFAGIFSIAGQKDTDIILNHSKITGCANTYCKAYGAGTSETVKYMYRPHIIVKK